ncbi:MAG: acetyl-CoA carboxylase biotin carboxylase subunit, partial [Myxococcota bacterium]
MFEKILVANRGEIALRVIRACRDMGIRSVAVHSAADADALHVRAADESVCIGPAPSRQSYLAIPALISAAEVTGADAVHPGYGFLAESAEFADVCGKCGLTFIGPPAAIIAMMGDKVRAREAMQGAGLPILEGSGVLETETALLAAAARIGFPVLLKASAGGGGRGMKIVDSKERLATAFSAARAEALAAFGNPDVYLERYVARARHVEVQILADRHGGVVHLFERECSIQRRHQKLVEECPSPALDAEARRALCARVVEAARRIGYQSLGTVEFLYDAENGQSFFMEMNPRLQVEHTVTEMVTGVDLVREQIRVAAGEPLGYGQEAIAMRGWAIEARINAEDPVTFAPSPGRITALRLPGGPGVRVDTHIYEQYVVPPHYDSLLAKIVAHGDDRAHALRRLGRALHETIVEGPRTNLDLFRRLLENADFLRGDLDTKL